MTCNDDELCYTFVLLVIINNKNKITFTKREFLENIQHSTSLLFHFTNWFFICIILLCAVKDCSMSSLFLPRFQLSGTQVSVRKLRDLIYYYYLPTGGYCAKSGKHKMQNKSIISFFFLFLNIFYLFTIEMFFFSFNLFLLEKRTSYRRNGSLNQKRYLLNVLNIYILKTLRNIYNVIRSFDHLCAYMEHQKYRMFTSVSKISLRAFFTTYKA